MLHSGVLGAMSRTVGSDFGRKKGNGFARASWALGPTEFGFISDWLGIFRALTLTGSAKARFERLDSNLKRRLHTKCSVLARVEATTVPMLASKFGWLAGDILEAACRIDANAFRLEDGSSRAVFGLASMINHDCAPNARVEMVDGGRRMRLLARRRIDLGQEVTITYCSPLMGTGGRRQSLLKSKLFLCSCGRCQDPTERGSHMGSVRCTKCPRGLMTPEAGHYVCNTCSFQCGHEKVDGVIETAIKNQSKILTSGQVLTLSTVKKLLYEQRLPPTAACVLDFKINVVNCPWTEDTPDMWKTKLLFLKERIAVLDLVDPGDSRLLAFLHLKLHQLCLKVGDEESRSQMRASREIVKRIQGDNFGTVQ